MSKQEEKKPSGQEKEEVKKGSKEAALAEEILVSTLILKLTFIYYIRVKKTRL
jgi:hypothetical protein